MAVLIESTKLLRNALPSATKLYQADPGKIEDSKFFQELSLEPSAYIQRGWGELMEELSQRLTKEQLNELQQAAEKKTHDDHLTDEDLTSLYGNLRGLGIVQFGKLRSDWLLHNKPYSPFEGGTAGLLADLLLAIATMSRVSGAQPVIVENGSVEFRRDGRVVASFIIASGCGHRGKQAVEAEVDMRRARYQNCVDVLVGGTSDSWTTSATPPENISLGYISTNNIVGGSTTLPFLHIGELRQNHGLIQQVLP